MYPKPKSYKAQQGSMLIIALFVMVVLSLLGVTMVKTLSASSQSVVNEVMGLRALQAARAGLELNIAQVFPVDGSTAVCGDQASPAGFGQIQGLQSCRFFSRCVETPLPDGAVFYRFRSEGLCEAGGMVVSRSVSVEAMQ